MNRDILYPLRRLHGLLVEGPAWLKQKRSLRRQLKKKMEENSRTVLLVMTPDHRNIGDHAIAWSIREFLKKQDIAVVEICTKEIVWLSNTGLLSILNGYPILINGGGNIGTLWPNAEKTMEDIVRYNPRSPIFIMPNSAFFEDSDQGAAALQQAKKIFGSHRHLTIYAREKLSYDLLKEHFLGVKLVPDMVLSLNWDRPEQPRKGCILCLRSDRERTRSQETDEKLRRQAETVFGEEVTQLDMLSERRYIPPSQHENCTRAQMERFSRAELVITDRLHAMIFCAVTATPCLVVNSRSPKVRGCYQWLSHLEYIYFMEDEDLQQAWNRVSAGNLHYDNGPLLPEYERLRQDLEELFQKKKNMKYRKESIDE